MSTISQLESSKFESFRIISDERKRNASINAVKYIKTLASMSNTDIMHWDITGLFSAGDGHLLTDRTSINKVFFSYRENAPANPTSVPEHKYTKLLKLTANRQKYNSQSLLDQAQRKMNEATNYYNNYYMKYLKESAALRRRHQAMQGYVPNYAAEIDALVKGGFYCLADVTDECVIMDTINDVILTHIHERHGVKRSVNMGKFQVSYNLFTGTVHVYGLGNNCSYSGYIHPHISSNRVCFGDLNNDAHDLIVSGNLTGTMEIVQKVLTTYNDGSPYMNLEYFEKARKNIDAGRTWDADDYFEEEIHGEEEEPQEEEGEGND